jgi:hypothetical protein
MDHSYLVPAAAAAPGWVCVQVYGFKTILYEGGTSDCLMVRAAGLHSYASLAILLLS